LSSAILPAPAMGWERQRPHPSYLLPGRLPDREGLSRLAAGHREAAAALTDRRPGPAKGWEADKASVFPESSVSEASGGHEGGVPSPIDRTACLMNTGQVRQAFGQALRVGISGCDPSEDPAYAAGSDQTSSFSSQRQ